MKLLETKDLTKVFSTSGIENRVLDKINFTVNEGDFVSIMGPSGSGKSTLLYTASGMDKVTEGQVIFKDKDITKLSSDAMADLRLKEMGFVFQNNYLLKDLNIFDNICLPGLKANKDKEKVQAWARDLMAKMGIKDLGPKPIEKVSGGQLQRAAICRALINKPAILFADEPTGALNSKNSQEVLKIFHQLNKEGMTIVLVTHDPKLAAGTERIMYLQDGQLVEERYLGKVKKEEDPKNREEQTMAWLLEKGF